MVRVVRRQIRHGLHIAFVYENDWRVRRHPQAAYHILEQIGQDEIGVFEFVIRTGVVTEDDVRDDQGQGLVIVKHLDAVNAQDGNIGI